MNTALQGKERNLYRMTRSRCLGTIELHSRESAIAEFNHLEGLWSWKNHVLSVLLLLLFLFFFL